MRKPISPAVVRRLPKYYRYLRHAKAEGVERISSGDLSTMSGYTASQIRQDLNRYGDFGQQGYGYNVNRLLKGLEEILGLAKQNRVIIIGMGNLGHALANSDLFDRPSVQLVGLFDNDEMKKGELVQGLPIQAEEDLNDFLDENEVDLAVLTIPAQVARPISKNLYAKGVRGFWNFTSVDLKLGDDAMVEDVHLSESLIILLYYMKNPYDYKGVN